MPPDHRLRKSTVPAAKPGVRRGAAADTHPVLRRLMDQSMFAGPTLGVLGQMYGYHLSQTAPLAPDPTLHAIVRNTAFLQGHVLYSYYTTPGQTFLWWCMALPACAWLVGLVAVLAWRGMKLTSRKV
jgi:hypothetical protein